MNKRARNRLIIGGVIIAIIAGAGFMLAMGDNQEIRSVKALLAEGDEVVGDRTKVTGLVVGESWDGKADPMRFEIRDDDSDADTTELLKVEYGGVVPSGFGDKTKATLTGTLNEDGVFEATDMLTVCPTKYQTKKVMSVDELLADKAVVDVTIVVAGYPTGPVTDGVVTMTSREDGGGEVDVSVTGAVPEGIGKGAYIEVTGERLKDGTFRASKIVVKKKAS
jgi:cytochrome c-type biogenesis protein CcmE